MRESFIFYKSFYESLKELNNKDKLVIYDAICEYCINQNEVELKGIQKTVFTLIKPQLDADESNFSEISKYHWNWKGGVSSKNNNLRCSAEMKNWRNLVFNRDKFICQRCFKKGGELNAHHIIPFSVDKGKIFDVDNGITLCKECHINLHKKERLWLNES